MSNDIILKGKKSLRGFGKQKIDLVFSVVDFSEFSKMLRDGRFPLIVRLSDEQLNNKSKSNNEYNMLFKYYVKKEQFDDEFSNKYMVLDSIELEKEFYENKIYIDKVYGNDISYKVDVLYPGNFQEGFVKLGVFRRNGIMLDKSSLVIFSIRDMYMNAFKKYMEEFKQFLIENSNIYSCSQYVKEHNRGKKFVKKDN